MMKVLDQQWAGNVKRLYTMCMFVCEQHRLPGERVSLLYGTVHV